MTTKVDLHNPDTQKMLRKAGIRWTLRNYERNNLEVPDAVARSIGLKAPTRGSMETDGGATGPKK